MGNARMGDRSTPRERDKELDEKLQKMRTQTKKKKQTEEEKKETKKRKMRETVLAAEQSYTGGEHELIL
jgi:hypothetical protein